MISSQGRRRLASLLSLPALMLIPLIGCSDPTSGGAEVEPLSKADDWRDDLAETMDRTPHTWFGVLEIAYDEATAARAWGENVPSQLPRRDGEPTEPGVYGDLADVDFGREALVVWSAGQSGTCPGWLADISTDNNAVQLKTARQGDFCTDDYHAYRMVLAVDRDRLPAASALPLDDVPVDGLATALITTYPAG